MPERDAAPHLCDRGVDPGAAARDSSGRRRDHGLTARVPRAAWPEEERDLDAGVGSERGHLADLRRRSASSRRFPGRSRRTGTERALGLVEHGFEDARALRPRGSRCGSAVRPRSAARSSPRQPTPRTPRRRRDRSEVRARADEPVLDAEEQHLVELERPSVARAACPVEGRGAVVAREHVDQLGAVGPVRLRRELREEAEDRLAPSYRPAITPRPGTDQTASSAKSPRSARPSFRANASKILADDRSVLSRGHAPAPSAGSDRRRAGAARP